MNQKDALKLSRAGLLAESGQAQKIREAAGLSKADVASVVGVAGPTVGRWEQGVRRPGGKAAIRWVDLLNALEQQVTERR